jgi:hypothetical protein
MGLLFFEKINLFWVVIPFYPPALSILSTFCYKKNYTAPAFTEDVSFASRISLQMIH